MGNTQKRKRDESVGIITARDLEYAEAHKRERKQAMYQSWNKVVQKEQQDVQVQQSKTSLKKRDSVAKRSIRRFFGKAEKPVVEDMDVTPQRKAIRERERKSEEDFVEQLQAEQGEQGYEHYDQLTSGMLQVTPDTEPTSIFDLPAEHINAVETGVAMLKEHAGKPEEYFVEAGKYKEEPLFPRMPDMQDVKQGYVGDCYFLAAVSSIVQDDPQQMRRMMKDNGDNTVTVRLYRAKTKSYCYENQEKKQMEETQQKIDDGGEEAYPNMAPEERLEFLLQKIKRKETSGEDSRLRASLSSTYPLHLFQLKFWNDAAKEEMGICKMIMDEDLEKQMEQDITDPYHIFYGGLKEYRNLAKSTGDMQSTMEALEKLYEKSEGNLALDTFFEHHIKEYQKAKGVDPRKEDNDIIMQEIYVTVTKDLPEKILEKDGQRRVVKSGAVYANGPLWLRVLEKAYAASGLNQIIEEQSKRKLEIPDSIELATLDKSYAGIDGGSITQTIRHLTGQKNDRETLFSVKANENTLTYAMEQHFGRNWQTTVQREFHLSDVDIRKLTDALKKEDKRHEKSYTETDENGQRVTKYYREQAAGLDDLIRVILESKVKSTAQDPEGERRLLAQQLTDVLAQSSKSQLQFARFSAQYTKKAEETLEKIEMALKQNKPIGAGSAAFIPESVNSGGLNGEAISGGIVEGHAYSILGTENRGGFAFIVMRNPWAKDGNLYRLEEDNSVTDEMERSKKDNGVFLVELNDFMRKFDVLHDI